MGENLTINVTSKKNARLDKFISESFADITRSQAANLIEDGHVWVNGKACSKKYLPCEGDEIKVVIPSEKQIHPQDIPLSIVYEDDDVLVVDKPQGMVVHPAAGNDENTLVNALLFYCKGHLSDINGEMRPGILHRIDKDTSGLLLVAKNNDAHEKLAVQIKEHTLGRCYLALVHGNIKEDEFTIDRPMGRSTKDRKKMAITDVHAKEAITHFRVIERFSRYTLLRCQLETGRTHQIRVHVASIGHPVVGDKTYGVKNEEFSLKGQLLHACLLGFVHPKDGQYMEFTSTLPPYFKKILGILAKRVMKSL